jgi:hypothetical protein
VGLNRSQYGYALSMSGDRGFILVLVLIFVMMMSTNIIWSTSFQLQEMKLLKSARSRLHLEADLDRKITEISKVLSKNAALWFNHACAGGFCTELVRKRDDLWIERLVSGPVVILRVNLYANLNGVAGSRQLILLCREAGCEQQSSRKG